VTLEDLEKELFATKYWLRVLYMAFEANGGPNADTIDELIKALKNQSPDQFPDAFPTGQAFDDLQIERIPAIEQVGGEISGYLRQIEQLRQAKGRPPERA
jgi:hypothetical protein